MSEFDEKEYKKRSFKKAFKVQDEWKTPSILVNMIVPYLQKWESDFIAKNGRKPIMWLPCDEADSNYYTILNKEGFQIIRSHLNDDKNFFLWQPDNFDIAVTNIPFSTKMDFFERMIFDLKKPFVFLMNIMALNYQCVGNLFQSINPKVQFIIPDKKVSFDGHTSSFCSGYVCYDFIDHTEFVHLENNNTGTNFRK